MVKEKRPHSANCGNLECRRLLILENYYGFPQNETPENRIHKVMYPALDGTCILCACGHYTFFCRPNG